MDRNAEVLARIIEEMSQGMSGSRKAKQIAEKISQGKATYEDALDYARESSRIMTASMKRNIPEVLTDGKLFRAEADQVIRQPMKRGGAQVVETAAEIQQQMNEAAGIGINAVVPDVNEDQITGIITDICNAESYSAGADRLFTQIENFLEGTVDDCVRENADFHYQAGLDPTIERRTTGKCCTWCSNLAGVYRYSDVMDKGNDVFRRHRNCHCVVSYNPGNGSKKRQDVHSKRWTDGDRDDRIGMAESAGGGFRHTRTYASDLPNGIPINGEPNSIADKLNAAGEVIQRRKYGADGRAAVDYDLSDHGESWKHPTGAHKHVFDYSGEKIRRRTAEMTQDDLDLNADIIKKGVNYFDK